MSERTSSMQSNRLPPSRVVPTRPAFFVSAALALSCAIGGCGSPNKANIDLRRENSDLRGQIDTLKRQREADQASLASLQSAAGSLPNLPPERLDKLFTVHGVKFGRLTGSADLDPKTPGDEGMRVYVVPTDDESDALKAAGSFVVEAFDLGEANQPLVGRWTFDSEKSRKAWYSGGLLYEYVLTCPWTTTRPSHPDITLKVAFIDDLTRRQFTAQKQIKVVLAPTTAPSTPSSQPSQ